MNPIINPLWFYLIDTVTSLKAAFLVIGVLTCLVFICHLSWDADDFKEFWEYKYTKSIAIVGAISLIVGCLIPGIETSYKMLVASLVTPDNLATVGDSVSSVVDYIIESVNKLIESNQ